MSLIDDKGFDTDLSGNAATETQDITAQRARQLADYIINTDLKPLPLPEEFFYASLPLCVVDAVFSIGVTYTSTANTVVGDHIGTSLSVRQMRKFDRRHFAQAKLLCRGKPAPQSSQAVFMMDAISSAVPASSRSKLARDVAT